MKYEGCRVWSAGEIFDILYHFGVAQKLDNRNGRDSVHIRVNFTLTGYLTKYTVQINECFFQ